MVSQLAQLHQSRLAVILATEYLPLLHLLLLDHGSLVRQRLCHGEALADLLKVMFQLELPPSNVLVTVVVRRLIRYRRYVGFGIDSETVKRCLHTLMSDLIKGLQDFRSLFELLLLL